MFFRVAFLSFCFLLLSTFSFAQLQFGGKPKLAANSNAGFDIPIIQMPAFTPEEDVSAGSSLKAYRFAHPFFVDITPANAGAWHQMPDGTMVWAICIESRGAYSLNLIFDHFDLPEGAQLYIYSPDQSVVAGAFTQQSHGADGAFATLPLPVDKLVVEYSQAPTVVGYPKLKIGAVNHDYKNIFGTDILKVGNFGDADDCHPDMSCVLGNYPEEKSVVRLIVDGTEVCSGTLLNNTQNNGTPYFITAAHCLRSDRTDHTFLFHFNYQVPSCQTHIEGYKSQTMTGATIVARIDKMDCLLVRSHQTPPASYRPYWAGWDIASSFAPPFHSIHHPWGDVKKFARSTWPISPSSYPEVPNPFDNNVHWLVSQWQVGTTESGSSGCALFTANGRFIGGLSGGLANCSSPFSDYYYMMNKAYEYNSDPALQLKAWLNPLGGNVQSVSGFDFYQDALPKRISNLLEGDSSIFTQSIEGSSIRWMGNNTLGIDAVAERFDAVESATLEGIYLQLGKSFTTGTVNIKVWSGSYFSEAGLPALDTLVELSSFRAPSENLVMLKQKIAVVAPVSVSVDIPANNFALFHQYNSASRLVNTAYLRKDGSWQPFNMVHPNGDKSSAYIDLLATNVVLRDTQVVEEPKERIIVYPNPASQKVYFKWGIDPLMRLDVVSLPGHKLFSVPFGFTYGNEEVEITSLPNGIYLFCFVFDNATQVHRVVVKR